MSSLSDPELVQIDLYDGSQGETLLFITEHPDALMRIVRLCESLSQGVEDSVVLEHGGPFVLHGCVCVTCDVRPVYIPTFEATETGRGVEVLWRQSTDQWDDCVGLLEGLLEGSGHG